MSLEFNPTVLTSVAPEPQPSEVDLLMAQAVESHEVEVFSARRQMSEVSRGKLREYAPGVYGEMAKNPLYLQMQSQAVLKQLNATVDRIMIAQGDVHIPEVDKATKEMTKMMSDFQRKYDASDPKVQATFERWLDAAKGIFGAGRNIIRDMRIDAMSVRDRLAAVEAGLIKQRSILDRNVLLGTELLKENDRAVEQMINWLAILEEVRDHSQENMLRLQMIRDEKPEGSLERQEASEALETAHELHVRIETEYTNLVQRMFIAWTASPQIRSSIRISTDLSHRLENLRGTVIPTIKQTIVEWVHLVQAQEANKAGNAIDDFANNVISGFAQTRKEAIPELARSANKPWLKPETVVAMAESFVAQAEGIANAYREAGVLNAEIRGSIATAQRTMLNSSEKLANDVIAIATESVTGKQLESAQPNFTDPRK